MRYQNYVFQVPEEKIVRLITDTDAKNEADDDFAVVQALLSPKIENIGLVGAHYGIGRDADSMQKSYEEPERVVAHMGFTGQVPVLHGGAHPMPNTSTPVDSEGARLIVEEAMKADDRPLYAIFLGPLTDLASAYLMEPRIAKRLTAIWIGGGLYPDGGEEFNLGNDIAAANVVMASNIELWQVPKNVYEMMPVTMAELECRVRPWGKIGAYLCDQLMEHAMTEIPRKSAFRSGECWVLGDSPAVGLILYEDRFSFDWVQAPAVGADMNYIHTKRFRPIRVYRKIDSRLILEDLYAKLELFARKNNEV